MNYQEFLQQKQKTHIDSGFEATNLNPNLFDFQRHMVSLALRKGKFAIFADCGLGKTICQLEWANQVANYTKKPVLILAPLAVSAQTIREGEKFGIKVSKLSESPTEGIHITNYEQLENIEWARWKR